METVRTRQLCRHHPDGKFIHTYGAAAIFQQISFVLDKFHRESIYGGSGCRANATCCLPHGQSYNIFFIGHVNDVKVNVQDNVHPTESFCFRVQNGTIQAIISFFLHGIEPVGTAAIVKQGMHACCVSFKIENKIRLYSKVICNGENVPITDHRIRSFSRTQEVYMPFVEYIFHRRNCSLPVFILEFVPCITTVHSGVPGTVKKKNRKYNWST